MVELYYNSGQFKHTLKLLVQAFDTPFEMYKQMALFYEENNYFVNAPARAYRYDVLLRFAIQSDKKHEDIYRESLAFDMYLRENMKSRPEFAKDITSYKDQIREFYQKEDVERNYLKGYDEYNSKQLSKMTHIEIFE